MIKEKLDTTAWMDALIESDKWRNLNFHTSGKAGYGQLIHPTQEAAKKAADESLREFGFIRTSIGKMPVWEVSHIIQMPVKD
jgi:hypothetical protein